MTTAETKGPVKAQFAADADAYVASRTHAAGEDLVRLVALVAPGPTGDALDVATGGGHVALALAPLVRSVVASDITASMPETTERFLRQRGAASVAFREADAEALPFPDGAFDLVTCRIAPHHFPRPDRLVAEAVRVLKPGGRFVLVDSTVPEGALGEISNRFEAIRAPSHVRSLSRAGWRDLSHASGLELRAEERFPKRHDFADWTARTGMHPAARDALADWVLAADPDFHDTFVRRRAGGRRGRRVHEREDRVPGRPAARVRGGSAVAAVAGDAGGRSQEDWEATPAWPRLGTSTVEPGTAVRRALARRPHRRVCRRPVPSGPGAT